MPTLDSASTATIVGAARPPQAPAWARDLVVPGAIPALDTLRAVAILLVLMRHAVRPFWDSGGLSLLPIGNWDLAIPMINGWIGVDLFFVLSGFLIGTQLLAARARGDRGRYAFRRYILKRALRILPAYYAVLAVAALGLVPFFTVAPEYLGVRVAWHVLMLQDYLPSNIVVVFWSLGVEEKFYLLAPAVVAAVLMLPGRFARYALLVALAGAGLFFRYLMDLAHPEPLEYVAFFQIFRSPAHLCLEPLALGLLTALVHRDCAGRFKAARALFWVGVLGASVLIAGAPMLDVIGPAERLWQPTLIALAMALLVFGAAGGGSPSAFARPWFVATARLSYSLYLVHLLLIPGTLALVDALFDAQLWPSSARFAVFLPFFFAFSAAAALSLHLAVERPFLKLKDRIA